MQARHSLGDGGRPSPFQGEGARQLPGCATGLSLSNALTQMTLGGTTPFICVWLIEATGRAEAPTFYLMFAAALGVAALMALRPSQTTAKRKSRHPEGSG